MTLSKFISETLGSIKLNPNMPSGLVVVEFDVGLDNYGDVDPDSSNRIKFTVELEVEE